ncbi:ATP-binding protein [Cupriavidus sp. 2TAF22]|uniref:ATP-binding protein n=1 Tax=unclassified Cupriavidus TaxID=2640874 RepID=UPI003F8DF0C5
MAFTKAVRKKAKLRLALTGPSGSGKTLGALMIARGLGGRVACIDTENGSASLYSHVADFDVMELAPPFTPERYIAAIREAEKAGYDVLIVDSTTHEWSGSGGILELVDQVASAKFRGNSWSAWNELTPRHRAFIDAMLQSRMHIIATGRSKTETAQVEENGRKKVAKLGMKTEQRDGFEYEFTVVLDIVHDGHYANASKDRTGLFRGDAKPISEETGKVLVEWLESGVELPEPSADAALPQDTVDLDDALLTLRECANLDELKTVFGTLWPKATAVQRNDIKASYDKRKAELEPHAEAA